jgi:hypothetical protein
MAYVYGQATATTLPNDRILIVGGLSPAGPQVGAQIYDPTNGTFSVTGSLKVGRYAHTANLFPGGAVLIVGGETGAGPQAVPAEIFE